MLHSELLAQIPLFDTLAAEDLEALAGRMTERHYKAGEKVFDKNDQGSSMYIVQSGAVQIFLPGADPDEPRVVLKDARTGEYFGELSLFDDKPRSASVEATVDTTLLELTRVDFSDHLSKSRNAAMTILAEMAERLRETNALLSQRAARDVVKEFEENLSWSQKLADKVAELNGSWAFILFLLAITVVWAGMNKLLPHPFDEYPFQFYNLALAILVALQGPLIVMSQNRQSSKDRATAETDFRVNLKNEVGIETLLREVGALRAETNKRFEVLERSMRGDRIRAEIPIKKPGGPLGPS
ncbi:MAG: Acid-resistant locus arl7 [Labilithrix sp.]|nr:Acid-resistant locus arl7 [Labilithrix sp.]